MSVTSATPRRLAALGCAALLAPTLAACGSVQGGAAATGNGITMGSVRAFESLDPADAYDNGSWTVFYNIYQTLMTFQPGATTPTPDAATSCEFTDSGLTTYSCTLRSGLRFSNGDALDAAAVKYSFDRMLRLNPVNGSGFGPGPLVWNIASVATSGSTGVTFHLRKPDATFPDEIASGAGSIVDPKVFPADKPYDGTSPVGSGVYKVDSAATRTVDGSTQGTSITLSANSAYQGAASTPQNSAFTFRYYDTPQQLLAAAKAGKVDIAGDDLDPSDVSELQNQQQVGKGLQVQSGASAQIRLLVLDHRAKPFDDPAVRRAAASLIDQNALATGAEHDLVDPLYSVVPSGIGGHTTPFRDTYQSPDPVEARQELRSAGISAPVSFTLTYSRDIAGSQAEAEELRQQLENGGLFHVTLRAVDNTRALETGFKKDAYQAFTGNWYSDYPDAADSIAPLFGAYNIHYSSPALNSDLNRAAGDKDRTVANKPFAAAQQQIADDAVMVPLWQNKQFMAVQPDITGVPLTLDVTAMFRAWLIGKTTS
ncbi:ABC transporter substrate-binding protein [Phaeacidiphilus oryzae]|uniref:ABC transporter substrate-binding protein n=1 Tax=Phaeacidiphilus oryzae TaxID=348818 RepID=UPI00056737C4|nr:ABC transporter substrate-binding protein [Phaeacidiphilus oryzae]